MTWALAPSAWEESLFLGPRVTGQVTLPAAWARLPFGMGSMNVIFPPKIWKEREEGVTDETQGFPGLRPGPGRWKM